MRFLTGASVLAIAFVSSPGLVLAQSAAQNGPSSQEQVFQVEEIVVTAQKREQRLQDVPVSITAVSAQALARSGISNTRDLTLVAPGLVFSRNAAIQQPTIRGVGSRGSSNGDEANVALYVDGVYQASMFANLFELNNIERIEVLRGPQGTLFGRNATGGAISVITRRPSHDPSATVSARYGRFNDRQVSLYGTTGLTDTVAVDLAVVAAADDGYIRDVIRNVTMGDRSMVSARSKLEWTPNDAARLTFAAYYGNGYDIAAQSVQPFNRNTAGGNSLPVAPLGDYDAALSFTPQTTTRQSGASVTGSLDLGFAFLESVSSYQHNTLFSRTDSDASPAALSAVENHSESSTWTHELRLVSQGGEHFDWIVGAFVYDDDSRYNPLLLPASHVARQKARAYAAFTDVTWRATDQISVIGGLRYSYEEKDYQATRATGSVAGSAEFDAVTPKLTVQYQPQRGLNLYATYSEGFKSGTYNTTALLATPVQPETIDAYEIGIKADPLPWLRLNASAFTYRYDNLQISARDPISGVSTLQNAASAKLSGGELEATAVVSSDLDLYLGVAVLDTEYTSFPNALITIPRSNGLGNTQAFADVSGNALIRAPRLTTTVRANWEHAYSAGVARASGTVYYNDGFVWDPSERLKQDAYTMVNASISWSSPNDRYTIGLLGENLADARVGYNIITSTLSDYAAYEKPRRVSLLLSAKF